MDVRSFRWCWYQLTVCLLCYVSQCELKTTTNVNMTIRDLEECERMQNEVYDEFNPLLQYSVNINLERNSFFCPPEKQGFTCGIIMAFKDPFDSLGNKICVDMLGVPATIPNSQFSINVSDENGIMQRVYIKSRRFEKQPYNLVCPKSSNQFIKIVLRAMPIVDMCPDILPELVDHTTKLGTILVKQEVPTRTLMMQNCQLDQPSYFESFSLLKVALTDGYTTSCGLILRPLVLYRQAQACITLEFLSRDFSCESSISVSEASRELLAFTLPTREAWEPASKEVHCFEFPTSAMSRAELPQLVIHTDIWHCKGKIALGIHFNDTFEDDDKEKQENLNMRNLYMAVFISVISVCVLIMGLTCLCCLRMRARRQQHRSQATSRRRQPATNLDYDAGSVDARGSSAFWSSTSSEQIFGLPSYEEVTGGAHTSSSSSSFPLETDKPPAYETLYADESILPSSLSPPPSPLPEQAPSSSGAPQLPISDEQMAGPYVVPLE